MRTAASLYEPPVERTCRRCGATFTIPASWARRGEGVYCGSECKFPPPVTVTCRGCGKDFPVKASRASKALFCGRACSAKFGKKRPVMAPIWVRAWNRVDVRDIDECWPYQGSAFDGGYGSVKAGSRSARQTHIGAHVVVYESVYGPVPDGLWVLHHCDNPPCCNPRHLYAGTEQDNIRDKMVRGRVPRGEGHHHAKLTATSVAEIRGQWVAGGITKAALARQYGVTAQTILSVVRGDTWKHVV